MTSRSRILLIIAASAAVGVAVGGTITYAVLLKGIEFVTVFEHDTAIRHLVARQKMLEDIDQGEVESAAQTLEAQIDGEILLADSLLASDEDEMNEPLRKLIHDTLKHISDYRARPEYRGRVRYMGSDEPGDARVKAILARYQTNAP